MKEHLFLFVAHAFVLVSIGCGSTSGIATSSKTAIAGNELKVMGRFFVTDHRVELISSGAHFGVTFEGSTCTIVTSLGSGQDHNYIQYELDGVYQKRLKIRGTGTDSLRIETSSPGSHTLWIYKATEAHTGPVFVHQLIAKDIQAIKNPSRPLIEFIGNSITCGAASDPSEVPCGTGLYHDQHNAYMAYGPRVARQINSNFILSSVSGIGVYRNWNSDRPVMPDVYENADFRDDASRPWNFSTFSPAVVSIALGTNDFSNGDGKRPRAAFDSSTFTNAYVGFVRNVKSRYPDAKIALLNSPMISGNNSAIFIDCLKKVKRQIDAAYPSDRPVSIFLVEPMQPRGCSYHPNVEDHKILADQLMPFFRDLLAN
jgi:hypothetical protein